MSLLTPAKLLTGVTLVTALIGATSLSNADSALPDSKELGDALYALMGTGETPVPVRAHAGPQTRAIDLQQTHIH